MTPKYRIGQKVYLGDSRWQQIKKECPDCLGQKIWMVRTPAGETFETYCRTCWHGFEGCDGLTTEYGYQPYVETLTIGEVRIEHSAVKQKVQYMCEETGVGSGTLWDENKLYRSHYEAEEGARKLVQQRLQQNEDNQQVEKQRAKGKRDLIHKPRGKQ